MNAGPSDLYDILAAWDGKRTAPLQTLFDAAEDKDALAAQAVAYCATPLTERGATWLLKHALETGADLDAGAQSDLIDSLPALSHCEARLHVLQILDRLELDGAEVGAKVAAFLEDAVADQNKFVRAWAYSGYHALAAQSPGYEERARRLIEQALAEEAPSIQARLRKVLAGKA